LDLQRYVALQGAGLHQLEAGIASRSLEPVPSVLSASSMERLSSELLQQQLVFFASAFAALQSWLPVIVPLCLCSLVYKARETRELP
jgi:hypothetical protein